MKYQHIASTLGWDETPDTTEGVFLQPEEAASIDAVLGTAAANEATPEVVAGLNEQVENLTSQVSERDETISTQNSNITELQERVNALGKKQSGNGTVVKTGTDSVITEGKVPSYLSDDNPANQFADKRMKAGTKQ